ncbi:MAG: hypothetical protein AAFQ63_12615 [Cyanobacteria bacterium J06621_11]
MSNSSPATTKYRPAAVGTAIARVLAFGHKLLVEAPEQLLSVVERQARQLLAQQSELDEYKQQLQALQGEVKAL